LAGSVYQNQFPVAVPSTSDYVTGVQGGKSTNYLVSDVRDQALRTEVQNARNGQASLSAELSAITNSISAETTRATNVENIINGNIATLTTDLNQLSNYNYVINGGFTINQRTVSGTVTLSANTYGHDRWKAGASGCTYTFATSNGTTTITISAGSLIQVIEGTNLQSGIYTLSWSGTTQGKIASGSFTNSPITSTITGGANLNIEFESGTLTNVKLEIGSLATKFEILDTEDIKCKKYYEYTVSDFPFDGIYDGSNAQCFWRYKTQKRTIPTIIFGHSGTLNKIYVSPNNAEFFATIKSVYADHVRIQITSPTFSVGAFTGFGYAIADSEIY
jgi:hypothetical protein